jgi:hypothetical protein
MFLNKLNLKKFKHIKKCTHLKPTPEPLKSIKKINTHFPNKKSHLINQNVESHDFTCQRERLKIKRRLNKK